MKNPFTLLNRFLITRNLYLPRSPLWYKVRKKHLSLYPYCEYCGGHKNVEVHHVTPFHINRSLELAESNLISLCMDMNYECHFKFGHFKNWLTFNKNIREDCAKFNEQIKIL